MPLWLVNRFAPVLCVGDGVVSFGGSRCMGRSMYNKLLRLLALFSPILLGGCNLVLFDSKGQVGVKEAHLILTAAGLMLLVVVPVIILTVIFAIKYRASNLKATYTPEWDNSHKIEAVVWGVPCLIVLALSVICWQSTHDLDPAKPIQSSVKPLKIDVVSVDWKWVFIYPEQHIATVNQVAFPVDTPVVFEITSDAAMNSFFIPQLGSQIYAMAGMRSHLNLISDTVGSYDGMSANFSGEGFSGMKFKALVQTPSDFNQWVASVRQSAQQLDTDVYAELKKPSENTPVLYYASVDAGLFDGIVDKYMGMPMAKDASMKMDMGSDDAGANDVR